MSDESVQSNPLDVLADEFVARYRRGERPALSDYCLRHPELANDIRRVFPTLVVMEQARPAETDSGSVADGLGAAARAMPARLGDYRILREIARGGMGIVYEAEQESLGRHVALKVLPPQTVLDPRHLQRFHREARAAARLHHTNIVPVFGVGEHESLHYYVMQFIHGLGLDQVLDELRRMRNGSIADTSPEAAPITRTKVLSLQGGDHELAHNISVEWIAGSLVSGAFRRSSEHGSSQHTPRADAGGARVAGVESASPQAAVIEVESLAGGSRTRPQPHAGARGVSAPVDEFRVRPPSSDGSGSSHNLLVPGSTSLSQPGSQYWHSVARIGVQVAEAIEYAAGQGVLHRDIKPSNLLLDMHGTVWVTDFGLAKASDSDDLTQTGDIVGTLRYLAPERLRGEVSVRGDLYSLGVTLYEMLTLRPPFSDHDRARLVRRIADDEPTRPRALEPGLPHDLETIVLKAIAKDPSDRYETAAELAADLRQFLEDKPIAARPISSIERAWRWCRRNPSIAGLAAAVALLLASAVVILAIGNARIRRESAARQVALGDKESALSEKTAALKSLAASESLAQRRFYAAQMNLASDALGRGQLARVLDLLENQRPRGVEPDLRGFEWYYMWREIHRGLHASIRHDDEVWALAFSPDGSTLAVGGKHGTRGQLQLWDVETGGLQATLDDDEDVVHGVDFSPDGKLLASGSADNMVRIWDVAARRIVKRIDTGVGVRSLRWSRDGGLIAAGCQDATVQVYDAGSFTLKFRTTEPLAAPILGLAFAADGKHLVSSVAWGGPGMRTRIHDLSTDPPRLIREFAKFATDASPRDNAVVSYESGQLHVWDSETEMDRTKIVTEIGWLTAVRFSPDVRRVATAGLEDRVARLWDCESGRAVVQGPHAFAVQVVAVAPDGRYWASGSIDGEVKIWHYDVRDDAASVERDQPIARMFLDSPSRTLILGGASEAFARDVETGEPRPMPPVRHLRVVSPDGRILAAAVPEAGPGAPETIQIWDRGTGEVRHSWRLPDETPLYYDSIALSASGRLLAARSADCPIRVWDVSGTEPQPIPLESDKVNILCAQLAFSPDERLLAAAGQFGRVAVWNVATGEVAAELQAYESGSGWAFSVCFSPDGTLVASGNSSGIVRVWDVRTGRLVALLKGHLGEIRDLVFFPDGRRLAAASVSSIRLWDVEAGQELITLENNRFKVMYLAVTSDGGTLASGHEDGTVHLWRSQPR